MSSSVNIPNNYTFTLGGGLAISTAPMNITTKMTGSPHEPIATLMTGDVNKPISTMVMGDANKPITTTMQGNPQKPIAATMELMNLPRLTLSDIKDLMTPKLRIRTPNYTQLCFKLMGMELFSLCLSGEGQTITEPYVPNAQERCEITCCEPDTRPFPEQKGQTGAQGKKN
jgi:hypothetical protein